LEQVNKLYHHTLSEQEEEQQWIAKAKENPTHFGVLYKKYYLQIFRFVLKRLGDEVAAAEVVSDIFVKALQSIHKYENRGFPFSAWLFQIARNEVNLSFRKEKYNRTVTVASEDLFQVLEEMEDDSNEENVQLLLKGMKSLKPEELELLEMRYFERRPFKEVSEILEITESSAKVRMHRVMQKLKEIIIGK
jgi:RNA polymerase sigma-70 factor (ECF subfamily)